MQRDRDGRLARRTGPSISEGTNTDGEEKNDSAIFLGFVGSRHFFFSRGSSSPGSKNNDTDVLAEEDNGDARGRTLSHLKLSLKLTQPVGTTLTRRR